MCADKFSVCVRACAIEFKVCVWILLSQTMWLCVFVIHSPLQNVTERCFIVEAKRLPKLTLNIS